MRYSHTARTKLYCGENLTGSESKGRNGTKYSYYHCRKRCPVYIPTQVADAYFASMLATLRVEPHIMKTFGEILTNTFGHSEKETKAKRAELLKEIEELQNLINKAEDRMLAEDISMDNYQNIVNRYSEKKRNLKEEVEMLSEKRDNPVNFIQMAEYILTSLDKLYLVLPYDLKRAFIGSMFPGKVEISKTECRTTKNNQVLAFLRGEEKKQAVKTDGLSTLAPPNVDISKALEESVRKIYTLSELIKL